MDPVVDYQVADLKERCRTIEGWHECRADVSWGNDNVESFDRCHILTEIFTTSTPFVENIRTKGHAMEPNQTAETDAELVTETLVEEVSIDGMCGVY